MPLLTFIGLLLVMALSGRLTPENVESRVDIRKREVLQQAGCVNEFDIYNRVFCLCPSCHQRPLLHRLVATTLSTVHRHKKNKPLPAVSESFGQRHYISVEEYFALYRKYVRGEATESGMLLMHTEEGVQVVSS